MRFSEYQLRSRATAVIPDLGSNIAYPALGLQACAAIAEKVKKAMRDDGGTLTEERREAIAAELGDVLWKAPPSSRPRPGSTWRRSPRPTSRSSRRGSGAPSCWLGRQPLGRLRRCAVARLGDEVGREPPHLALRQAARTSTPPPESSRSSIGAPSAYSSASFPPSSYGSRRRTSSKRSAKRSAIHLQRADAGARCGGDLERVGKAVREPSATEPGRPGRSCSGRAPRADVVGADLVQHRFDRSSHLVQPVVRLRRVEDVEDEVGDERLLERRGEAPTSWSAGGG